MASPKEKRLKPTLATASDDGGALPADVLYEFLVRLPAKSLCRLHAVCRKWHSLLSDPLFAAAHAARHRAPPLLVACVHGDDPRQCGGRIDIMDISGSVTKRIRVEEDVTVVPSRLGLVCVFTRNNSVRVLDPVTGSLSVLPDDDAWEKRAQCPASFAFGQVASTGEYKVVRVLHRRRWELCEVFTLEGGCRGHWREKKNPPVPLGTGNGVAINGVAYFLLDHFLLMPSLNQYNIEAGRIASFDLGTEEWSVALRGPLNSILDDANGTLNYMDLFMRLTLAELKGCLVTAHRNEECSLLDLWFLTDIEKGIWSRVYRIQTNFVDVSGQDTQPLLVLDEEKIVLWVQLGVWLGERGRGCLRMYDPRTNTSTDVLEMRYYSEMGMFTGSPLCLASP